MIALFVATMPTRPAQRNEAAERMAEIVTARRQLSDEKVAAENASRLFEDAILRRLYRRRLMRLALDIALLDKRLAAMVSANVALAQRYRLLTSMPGVGPVLAFTLIALLPELGQMSRRQVAELRTGRSARTHLPEGTHIVGQMGPTHCSFDHVVGAGEEWGRDVEAEGSGGLEVDNEIVPRGLLDRDLRGMRAAKNAVHKVRMASRNRRQIRAVGHQTSSLHHFTLAVDGGKSETSYEIGYSVWHSVEDWLGNDEKSIGAPCFYSFDLVGSVLDATNFDGVDLKVHARSSRTSFYRKRIARRQGLGVHQNSNSLRLG